MLRKVLAIAAVVLLAGWSLSLAQMMGGGRSMMQADTSSTAPGSWMGRGMMSRGMMGPGMMGYGMMGRGMMGPGMMGGGMMGMMGYGMPMSPFRAFINLGLSDKQIGKTLDIGNDVAKDQLSQYRKLAGLQKQLYQAQSAPDPDMQKVKDLAVQITSLSADLQAGQVKANQQAMKVLTEEQQSKLADSPYPLVPNAYCPMMGNKMAVGGCGYFQTQKGR